MKRRERKREREERAERGGGSEGGKGGNGMFPGARCHWLSNGPSKTSEC